MGKIGQSVVRLVSRMPTVAGADELLILCPFLEGLDPSVAMWLGPLAWHDCNGALLCALPQNPPAIPTTVFAGVFCAEPFRAADEILTPLRAAGIAGIVNLPSVSFLDGEVAGTLEALKLGVERELRFLEQARSSGFRIACCLRDSTMATINARLQPELVIRHAGPMRSLPDEHGLDEAIRCLTLSNLLHSPPSDATTRCPRLGSTHRSCCEPQSKHVC